MKVSVCKFCDRHFNDVDRYASHIESEHRDMIPPGMDAYQFLYFMRTGKTHGNCIICKKDTKWNPKTHKYHRFCENPKCKQTYIDSFQTRMISKYGKINLLTDPEQQKKMLENRRISGKYKWSTGEGYKVYTAQYELSFLEFLDHVMDMPFDDIMTPSPHNYLYKYEGENHFYFPDIFIPSLNLEIEIKDGGDNPNNHPKIQAVDKVKEQLKDDVMKTNGNFSYLKIVNKENSKFFKFLEQAKYNYIHDITTPIFMP